MVVSFDLYRSIYPRQDLFERHKETRPPCLGAAVGLLLIRPEAGLLDAQVGARARGGRVQVTTLSSP